MTTHKELKPCPYEHEVKRGMATEFCEEFDCYRAFCCDCSACGPTVDIADCGFSKRRAEAKAIEAWNTRTNDQAISTLTAEIEELRAGIEEQATWENPIHRVALRAGFILCREYMARFVEQGGDANTATSIRANWIPALGADPGPPRQMAFDEVVTAENMEEGPWESITPDLCVEAACYALCAANSLGMEWQCATLTKAEGTER